MKKLTGIVMIFVILVLSACGVETPQSITNSNPTATPMPTVPPLSKDMNILVNYEQPIIVEVKEDAELYVNETGEKSYDFDTFKDGLKKIEIPGFYAVAYAVNDFEGWYKLIWNESSMFYYYETFESGEVNSEKFHLEQNKHTVYYCREESFTVIENIVDMHNNKEMYRVNFDDGSYVYCTRDKWGKYGEYKYNVFYFDATDRFVAMLPIQYSQKTRDYEYSDHERIMLYKNDMNGDGTDEFIIIVRKHLPYEYGKDKIPLYKAIDMYEKMNTDFEFLSNWKNAVFFVFPYLGKYYLLVANCSTIHFGTCNFGHYPYGIGTEGVGQEAFYKLYRNAMAYATCLQKQ